MSGLEKKRDGVLRLRSELKGHAKGHLKCPSQLVHRVELENCSVCDVQVSFAASPQTMPKPPTSLITYALATPWTDSFRLDGSSKPRGRREDWREAQINILSLPTPTQAQQRQDIDVDTTYQSTYPTRVGPVEASVSVKHRLVLQ